MRWLGYGPNDDTWEPPEHLENCPAKVEAFRLRQAATTQPASSRKRGRPPKSATNLSDKKESVTKESADNSDDDFFTPSRKKAKKPRGASRDNTDVRKPAKPVQKKKTALDDSDSDLSDKRDDDNDDDVKSSANKKTLNDKLNLPSGYKIPKKPVPSKDPPPSTRMLVAKRK